MVHFGYKLIDNPILMKKKILLLLVALVLIQFIRIDKNNPPIVEANDYLSISKPTNETSTLIKNACYDCHSHDTSYPWYTNIAPLSWWIKGHINGGREKLNFSDWGNYSQNKREHKLEECVDFVERKSMPLKSYTWLHSDAKLDEIQRKALVQWFSQH